MGVPELCGGGGGCGGHVRRDPTLGSGYQVRVHLTRLFGVRPAFKSTLDFEPPKIFVDVSFLNPNMIIEQEIRTNRDQLIARKGQRVTQTLMNIVHHCLENKAVAGEVWVTMIEPEEHEQTESEEKAQSF